MSILSPLTPPSGNTLGPMTRFNFIFDHGRHPFLWDCLKKLTALRTLTSVMDSSSMVSSSLAAMIARARAAAAMGDMKALKALEAYFAKSNDSMVKLNSPQCVR